MVTIGLTGSFGTGKSFVAGIFKKLGARVIDADRLAHGTLKKGSPTFKKIVSEFGRTILNKDGSIDRKALGELVFNDRKRLNRLNRIIHPVVIGQIQKRMDSPGGGILVVDAPLICEAGLSRMFNALIVVKASKQKQIERCARKFNLSERDVCKRIVCQMPLESKIKKADYVVDNDGTRKGTEKQVTRIWQELKPFGKSSGLYTERSRSIKKGATVWR